MSASRYQTDPHARAVRLQEMAIMRLGGGTLEEIGAAYGLTRERARQILAKAGVPDPRLVGFSAFNAEEFARRTEPASVLCHNGRRRALHHFRAWRRQAVDDLRALAACLGRTPTYREVGALYGIPNARHVITMLGWRWCGRTDAKRSRGMHRWYRLAGLVPRKQGVAGHV